jgi:hypothetical protein
VATILVNKELYYIKLWENSAQEFCGNGRRSAQAGKTDDGTSKNITFFMPLKPCEIINSLFLD